MAAQQDSTPTFDDVVAAAAFLGGAVMRTPVIRSGELDALAGTELWLKAECSQHIGAFKARGALRHVGKLAERLGETPKLITYSSGNHAQAVALAAKRYGVSADITMPKDAPAIKVERVRALGASIHFAGYTSAHRKDAALELQHKHGGHIVPPFDDPDIIAGQGTATLELLAEAQQDGGSLDALIVPVGGGGLIAGACLVAAHHGVIVYSAEPRGCDAMGQSLEAGHRVAVEPESTIADGLKPVEVGELNFAIAKQVVRKSFRVDDREIGHALTTLLFRGKTLVEPSGAAALAVALRGEFSGLKRVGVILSGGNIGAEQLATLLRDYPPHAGQW